MTSSRFALALAACGAFAVAAQPAAGAVKNTRQAEKVARAIAHKPSQVVSAAWLKKPQRTGFAAVSTTKLVGFPRSGSSFALLSSGDASKADNPNNEADMSTDLRGPVFRGTRDTTVLRVDLRAPRGSRCLSFSFRFLSDEFDEFVNTDFNDAFIASYRRAAWSSAPGSAIIKAPNNFAFDRERKPITVNSTGDFSVTAARARGTTYDAGTRRLRASRSIKPGVHRIYFSIFDQGDRQFDSTVVLDRLVANDRKPCVSGAELD
jgi:hypothetical protein